MRSITYTTTEHMTLYSLSRHFYGYGVYRDSILYDNLDKLDIETDSVPVGTELYIRRRPRPLASFLMDREKLKYYKSKDDIEDIPIIWKLQDNMRENMITLSLVVVGLITVLIMLIIMTTFER